MHAGDLDTHSGGRGPHEERWSALVQAARAEFWGAGQDPNEELSSTFALRLLRGRIPAPGGRTTWYTRQVTDEELANGDPAALAREFYARYLDARGGDVPR